MEGNLCETTTLLSLLTEPGLGTGEDWLIREINSDGVAIVAQLDDLRHTLDAQIEDLHVQHCLTRPVRAWWNDDMSGCVITAVEHIERDAGDPQCALLMHKSLAYSLGQ